MPNTQHAHADNQRERKRKKRNAPIIKVLNVMFVNDFIVVGDLTAVPVLVRGHRAVSRLEISSRRLAAT